jgi:hypothetical protein
LVPLRLLSVRTSEPLRLPAAVGVKLIGSVQDASIANVPAELDVLPINGQAVDPLLFNVKLVEMLGSFPLDGTGKVSAAFPRFHRVTVCGLSLLVVPAGVEAKLRVGGSDTSTFNTRLLPVSAM